jgi:hypothetical protein
VDYWDVTSGYLTKNPYVVGFDPLNEPGPSQPLQHPELNIPGVIDRKLLAPMYDRIYQKYQSHDTQSLMWFEPTQFPDWVPIGSGYVAPVGFTVPPGGEIGSSNHVLNDHTYCCSLGLSVCADGEPST